MGTRRIVTWRWEYLRQVEKFRSERYLIVYLDETCFYSHNTARMVWSDNTEKCTLSATPSKGKRIIICHTGSTEGFVSKKLSESYADYHDNMNEDVFEDWFENTLLKKLPQDRKVLIVMVKAKYHSRLSEKTPKMNINKKLKKRYHFIYDKTSY